MKVCPQHGEKWIAPKNMVRHDHRGEQVRVCAGQCLQCFSQNNSARVGKTLLKAGDRPLPADYDTGYSITRQADGSFSPEAFTQFKQRLLADEVRWGEAQVAMRRPSNVSKERFGAAVRSAAGDAMLTASPDSIRFGLDHSKAHEHLNKRRVAKGAKVDQLVIKPSTLHNAKYGRNSTFWGERLWTVFSLRYGRGYIVTTELGDDSVVFPSVGQLRSAIKKSGWEIVR